MTEGEKPQLWVNKYNTAVNKLYSCSVLQFFYPLPYASPNSGLGSLRLACCFNLQNSANCLLLQAFQNLSLMALNLHDA